ncbi:MAG: hypothetical protein C5B51_08395 [Terriglobia bacterium]|nr:MAG: hypothetical protein C5B51_08395 [Terriglobia bacterium]
MVRRPTFSFRKSDNHRINRAPPNISFGRLQRTDWSLTGPQGVLMNQNMSAGRFLRYALYNWTREMPAGCRLVTMTGVVFQGYAFYALLTR